MKKNKNKIVNNSSFQLMQDKQSHIHLKIVSETERNLYRVPSYGYIL